MTFPCSNVLRSAALATAILAAPLTSWAQLPPPPPPPEDGGSDDGAVAHGDTGEPLPPVDQDAGTPDSGAGDSGAAENDASGSSSTDGSALASDGGEQGSDSSGCSCGARGQASLAALAMLSLAIYPKRKRKLLPRG
jgi:hypothetical protein